MLQFWRNGYESTTTAMLCSAMQLNAPSLYSTFGDKETLFLTCLERYEQPQPRTAFDLIEEASCAREAAQALLEFSIKRATQANSPLGCLVANAAASGANSTPRMRSALAEVRQRTKHALQTRIAEDIVEGRLSRAADADALAAMVMALLQGFAILARDGMQRDALLRAAGTAMSAWPAAL